MRMAFNRVLILTFLCLNIENTKYFFFQFLLHSDGSYEISEADGVQRGTKIILHLKKECNEFSKEQTVKGI